MSQQANAQSERLPTTTTPYNVIVATASSQDISDATDDLELFQLAAQAAKDQVQTWIRAVLREVALQALRMSMMHNVKQTATATVAIPRRITINTSDIDHAVSYCRLVTTKWIEQLQKVGHEMVGIWIHQIVQTEIDNLFYSSSHSVTTTTAGGPMELAAPPPPSATDPTARETTTTINTLQSSNDSEAAVKLVKVVAPAAPTDRQGSSTNKTTTTQTTKINTTTTTTTIPYARLRSLGAIDHYSWQRIINENGIVKKNHDKKDSIEMQQQYAAALHLDEAIQELDQLGCNGQTYWPYSWTYIEQAAAQIPQRLYNNNNNINTTSNFNTSAASQLQQQPAVKDDHVTQNSKQQERELEEEELVLRKRKSSRKGQFFLPRKRTMTLMKNQQQQEQTNDLLLPIIKRIQQRQRQQTLVNSSQTINNYNHHSRPASNDTGHFQWNIQEGYTSFTPTEKKRLDACLHDLDIVPEQHRTTTTTSTTARVTESPPVSILLGALCPVGQYHYSKQRYWIDADDNSSGNKKKKTKHKGSHSKSEHDHDDNDPSHKNKEQKRQVRRQRRQQRMSVRERLGDHCAINADHGVGKLKRVSKILQTTSSSSLLLPPSSMKKNNENDDDDHIQQQQQQQQRRVDSSPAIEHWIDFDLGYCMLELVIDPSTGKKGLFAFESLEVMALDEDDCSSNNDDNDDGI